VQKWNADMTFQFLTSYYLNSACRSGRG
jgi:hypothetical protein